MYQGPSRRTGAYVPQRVSPQMNPRRVAPSQTPRRQVLRQVTPVDPIDLTPNLIEVGDADFETFEPAVDAASAAQAGQTASSVEDTYVVRPGDTLWGIAGSLYPDATDPELAEISMQFMEANGIRDPRTILPDQPLLNPDRGLVVGDETRQNYARHLQPTVLASSDTSTGSAAGIARPDTNRPRSFPPSTGYDTGGAQIIVIGGGGDDTGIPRT